VNALFQLSSAVLQRRQLELSAIDETDHLIRNTYEDAAGFKYR
jgi:hypothetical protein